MMLTTRPIWILLQVFRLVPLGHGHPKVVAAIKEQLDQYLHVMVYGEYIQEPAVELAKFLAKNLPNNLEENLFNQFWYPKPLKVL